MTGRAAGLALIVIGWCAGNSQPSGQAEVSIRLLLDKPVYPAGTSLRCGLVFANTGKGDYPLTVVRGFRGETSVNASYTLRALADGGVWYVGPDPAIPRPAAPLRRVSHPLAPGQSYTVWITLPGPGFRFWQGRDVKYPVRVEQSLPPGRYELSASVYLASGVKEVGPEAFRVGD